MFMNDPSDLHLNRLSRSVSFENPTGAKGAGGSAHGGRKGAPNRLLRAGETVTLADLDGPGTLRHFWATISPMPPEIMRAVRLEVFYDGLSEPSISVPMLDFFGAAHGRPTPLATALTAVQEGRGFNAYFPMPFHNHVRVTLSNESPLAFPLYYQIDYTLEENADESSGVLHATFRRENPTTMKRDFVIVEGIRGPGRFLGCVVGIRILQDEIFAWYGEGEVKMFIDGDTNLPTICGTGLEDYAGTAWGMGAHQAPYQGVPLEVIDREAKRPMPDFASFYRWHLPDPVVFREDLKVTIQQIGAVFIAKGDEAKRKLVEANHPLAGPGWQGRRGDVIEDWGIAERVDDYCATAFVYASAAQPVPRYEASLATADVERRPYERPGAFEKRSAALGARAEP